MDPKSFTYLSIIAEEPFYDRLVNVVLHFLKRRVFSSGYDLQDESGQLEEEGLYHAIKNIKQESPDNSREIEVENK